MQTTEIQPAPWYMERIKELEGKLVEWQDCARQKQEIIDSETALRKEAESRLREALERDRKGDEIIVDLTAKLDAATSRLDSIRRYCEDEVSRDTGVIMRLLDGAVERPVSIGPFVDNPNPGPPLTISAHEHKWTEVAREVFKCDDCGKIRERV